MNGGATARYAIYFAPAATSPWWQFGAHWLGRDDRDGRAREQPRIDAIDPGVLRQITAAPRRYGFHATLKAPFRLRHASAAPALHARVAALAATLSPVPLGDLAPLRLGEFVALAPRAPIAAADVLAAACVTGLDDLRAPATTTETADRRAVPLDARELELLERFGYPFVLEKFRLHFTLTGKVDAMTAARVCDAVAGEAARLNAAAPLAIDRLCVFVEPGERQPLLRIADYTLRR